jgi:hypothetical protein
VEAMLWCGGRLFSGGLDEQLHEHSIETGQLKVGDTTEFALSPNKIRLI